MSEDSIDKEDRRKLLTKAFPFMVNAIWEAHSMLNPGKLASVAVDRYRKIENEIKTQHEELSLALGNVSYLDLQVSGIGRLSLTMSREQILSLAENYLSSKFVGEGGKSTKFVRAPKESGFDSQLNLPLRSVFAKLRRKSLNPGELESELVLARKWNPSELWIFSYEDLVRTEIPLDPVFVGENKVLRGRLRVMPVSDMFKEISQGRFTASSETLNEGGEEARFLLVKNNQVSER